MESFQSVSSKPTITIPHLQYKQPLALRILANFFSVIFHPLFIPLYATYYLTYVDPYYFNGFGDSAKVWVMIRVIINMVFFPIVSVVLLKAVGFIDSILLKTQKERIIPYVISNIFFFWMFLVFHNQPEIPLILTSFVFSVFLSSSVSLLVNTYLKISMHAIGTGGLLGLMIVILFTNNSSQMVLPLSMALLITGVVCTSRMIVSNHSQKDIYAGLLCGMMCQFLGAAFIL
jgi:hypothetical protein